MAKVLLNYDQATYNITTDDGHVVGSWAGLPIYKSQDPTPKLSVEDLIALKKADYTVDEIAELKRQKLI